MHRSSPYGQSHMSKVASCTNRMPQAVASSLEISHLVPTLMMTVIGNNNIWFVKDSFATGPVGLVFKRLRSFQTERWQTHRDGKITDAQKTSTCIKLFVLQFLHASSLCIPIKMELSAAARPAWPALSPPIVNYENDYKYAPCFHLLSK